MSLAPLAPITPYCFTVNHPTKGLSPYLIDKYFPCVDHWVHPMCIPMGLQGGHSHGYMNGYTHAYTLVCIPIAIKTNIPMGK